MPFSLYTRGNDTLQEADEDSKNEDIQSLEDEHILAEPQSHQIQKLTPAVQELKTFAGEDFSQIPRGEKDLKQFVRLGLETQNKIQQLVQQGYELGNEIDLLDAQGESTGEKFDLIFLALRSLGLCKQGLMMLEKNCPKRSVQTSQKLEWAYLYMTMRLLTTIGWLIS